jgi:SAM-dependent methyltransferase
MAVWDIETTEGETGGGKVTWELDDLDVWGTEADMDDLSSKLVRYDPFHDPTHRNPAEGSSRASKHQGVGSQPYQQPQSPSAEEPPSFDLLTLEPEERLGWNFSQPFDFIHVRTMKGCFAYWEEVYAEIYRNLRPGGYIEVADYEVLSPEMLKQKAEPGAMSDESSQSAIPPSRADDRYYILPTVRRLYITMMEASFKAGRPLGMFYMHKSFLEEAGFKDVRTTYVNVPVGPWPEDEEQKRIGKMFLVVLMESFEAHLLRLATKYGDAERRWTAEEVREKIEVAKQEVLELSEKGADANHEGWCANFRWVIGRKSKIG